MAIRGQSRRNFYAKMEMNTFEMKETEKGRGVSVNARRGLGLEALLPFIHVRDKEEI